MLFWFLAGASLIMGTSVALHFFTRLRRLQARSAAQSLLVAAPGRYRPMLRLLSKEDAELVSSNKSLARKLRRQRSGIFRDYLQCLQRDYGRLLTGLRLSMLYSRVERPDLALALLKYQALFAFAICRIEYRLFLHNSGFGSFDVSLLSHAAEGLVDAIDSLRREAVTPGPVALGAH